MAEDETTLYLLVIVMLVAVVGLGLSAASFATQESVGGMMSGGGMTGTGSPTGTSGPGAFEWTVLLISAAFFGLALILLLRRRAPESAALVPTPPAAMPAAAPRMEVAQVQRPAAIETAPSALRSAPPIAEPTLVRLLDEDERRMYLELRDHGGQMFQRDLVALGIFSKAKVTRVLDKLETKGLVVREAHGMTNMIRLVAQPAK